MNYKECEYCHGDGYIEVSDCTVGSSSICCGGCTNFEKCPECFGSGEIEYEIEDDEEI